jgi:hypothetical protein
MKGKLLGILLACLASPALAQSSGEEWSDLPDRFQVDAGYFGINAETDLRFSGRPGAGTIDFERDLGVDPHADTFWLDATWRVGRRHQIKLGYTRLNRERDGFTLERTFGWGGQNFDAGLSASSTTGSDILAGYYRFAVVRNERFEIGPAVAVGELWVRAEIRATGTITGPGGIQVSRTLDEDASTSSITGALGAYASAWPAKRLVLRADFLYFKVHPENSEASITDWRVGADFYFFRNAGLGVQYKYNKYRYDRGQVAKLGGEITYDGLQAFLSFLF